MKDYKAIIFDLDGTLLNTLDDLAASTNHALREMGYPERTLLEVRTFVGNGVAKLIERAVPAGTALEKAEETLAVFKKHYATHCEEKTAPYEGVISLLDKLLENGKILAVVSNKLDSAVAVLCKQYFGDRMTVTVGDRDGIRKKPYPDSVNEVLARLGISKEEAIYIGDSDVDIETAKNAEMDCISVTWGFRDRDILLRAWQFDLTRKTEHRDWKKGISYGKGIAYFADTAHEVENILLPMIK